MTVLGPIERTAMGFTLTHEHLFADLRTFADQQAMPISTDAEAVGARVLPLLASLRAAGVRTIVDATATHLGRSAALLADLSTRSGLNIIMPTGVYLAADGRFIPDYARTESAAQLAARWIAEYRDGIGGTGVKPGFMKTSVAEGPLSDLARKAMTAAAQTHRETGLPIGTHIGQGGIDPGLNAAAAEAILELLAAADAEIYRIFIRNPADAFRIGPRPAATSQI